MKSLLAVLACVWCCGCATMQNAKTLTLSDNDQDVVVSVGQVVTVELPSNHATGFRWIQRVAGEPVLQPLGEPAYQPDSSAPGTVGTGGMETWRFRAVKAGQQTLHLEYLQPWQQTAAPGKAIVFHITANPK